MHSFEDDSFADTGETDDRVNLVRWLLLVFCWDGVLPALVLTVPLLAHAWRVCRGPIPDFGAENSFRRRKNNQPLAALKLGVGPQAAETVTVIAPILAFFVRLAVGLRTLGRNHCGPVLQLFQVLVFFLAAVMLVCIDSLMLLAMEMNNGRLWTNQGDLIVLLAMLGLYFTAMLFVFYPGRSPVVTLADLDSADSGFNDFGSDETRYDNRRDDLFDERSWS